jgi:L-threonylcarbamoyladenylate synthase
MSADIPEAVAALQAGGLILVPTDTVYGLAVSPAFPAAVERLGVLKGRPRDRFYPIMVASPDDLLDLGAEINPCAERLLASRYVPGPLTLAIGFRDAPTVPWLSGREEIGIRIPDDARMLDILRQTGPLFVTSANKHGEPTHETVPEILAQLGERPDVVIDGGVLHTVPSTLVNCRCEPPAVERVGVVPEADVKQLLGL